MQSERHRARRYPFAAGIELIDLQSEAEMQGQTRDLSLFGCSVNTVTPWKVGTRVRVRILHKGAVFVALGRVANTRGNAGMGVIFTTIEAKNQMSLEKWVDELRGQ
jgi:hypothetical protein